MTFWEWFILYLVGVVAWTPLAIDGARAAKRTSYGDDVTLALTTLLFLALWPVVIPIVFLMVAIERKS